MRLFRTTSMAAIVLMIGIGTACAEAKIATITVSREESRPQNVEVKVGEEVR